MKKEQWCIDHCPNIRCFHRALNQMKIYRLRRTEMKQSEVLDVENNIGSKSQITQQYLNRWPNIQKNLDKKIEKYVNRTFHMSLDCVDEEVRTDIYFSYFAYGFFPDEYFVFGLQKKNAEDRRSYINERNRLIFLYQMNDIVDMDLFRNKRKQYEIFSDYYKRDAIGVKKNSSFEQFSNFIDKHPVFVKKSVRDNCGNGVELVDYSNIKQSKKAYFEHLKQGEYLLEECIHQSEIMRKLNPSSVNTLRCITLNTKNGIKIDNCFLKVGRGGSFLDNGSAGGLLVGINDETGILETDGYSEFRERYSQHPDTKVEFKGFQIPNWEKMLTLAKELSILFPTVRCLGWDFAHTEDGWVLVECNGRTQFIGPQIVYGRGFKKELSEKANITF